MLELGSCFAVLKGLSLHALEHQAPFVGLGMMSGPDSLPSKEPCGPQH